MMETLSGELLCSIAFYLPSIRDLRALEQTNQQLHKWAYTGPADKVYRELYKKHFPKADDCLDQRISGRQLWRSAYHARRSILLGHKTLMRRRGRRGNQDPHAEDTISLVVEQPLSTVQVLPMEEEEEAIFYDHPDVEPPDGEPCIGYFGLQPLFPSKTNKTTRNSVSLTPIAIWGDFPGLRVAPCWDALLNSGSEYRDQLVSIHDEGKAQVMSLQMHPRGDVLAEKGYSSPFFLAFASGVVMAVAYKNNQLEILSTSATHSSEVTTLAVLPPLPSQQHQHSIGYLLSVCVTGQVYLYPDSLTNMDLSRKFCLNPRDVPPCQVFSMSATVVDKDRAVLCLGGQGLKISMWQLVHSDTTEIQVLSTGQFEYQPHVLLDRLDQDEPMPFPVEHNITQLSFVGSISLKQKDVLVMGTSLGHIATWYLEGPQPRLQLHTSQERAHFGSVESIERVGNILLTSGGRDGMVKITDLHSGIPKARILFHPGRLMPLPQGPAPRARCAVVQSSLCHERKSIIGFCRDGHISEWSFRLKKVSASTSTPYYGGEPVPVQRKCKRKRPRSSSGNKSTRR